MKTFIALVSTRALRDTQLYTGPADQVDWDGQWEDCNAMSAFIDIYRGEPDKVLAAAAEYVGCDKEFISLIAINDADVQARHI